jgi:hypothetical protein
MDVAVTGQRVASPNEVTHGEILYRIGEIKGEVNALTTTLLQKREDLNIAFGRIATVEKTAIHRDELGHVEARVGELERGVAKWAGVALACSFIVPILVSAAQPYLHFGGKPAAASTHIEARQ